MGEDAPLVALYWWIMTAQARTITGLQEKVRRLKRVALQALYRAQSGHPGSTLSTMEMLVALYFGGILRHDPHHPHDPDRDYFLLSNGHACPALYAVLAEAGYFAAEQLTHLRQLGAGVQGHPHRGSVPGVEITSGSLGMGLSVGIGLAYALKLQGKSNRVYVMMSDGEQEEGSTWEAVMFAPAFAKASTFAQSSPRLRPASKASVDRPAGKPKLDNLIAIIDKNKFQIDGATRDVMPYLDPLADKYRAFGWRVQEIDGHKFEAIFPALKAAQVADGPAAIISHTIRGKGVSFMEGSTHWHAGAIAKEQYERAMKELV